MSSKTIRIIPKLDIKGPNLVKGIHLEGLRVLGRPQDFAKFYYEQGADELMYVDVVASLYNRNSLHDIISKTAQEVFIPLTVGGGIRTVEDIRSVLRAGADKVSLNTAAIKNPKIIRDAAAIFGSSTITVTIEATEQGDGKYLAYTDNGREHTGVEVLSWAKEVERLGAGEIVLTSIDREGTGLGYDVKLTKQVADAVGIPVVASGGAGRQDHVAQVITEGHADAAAVASLFHYDFIREHRDVEGYHDEGNIEFLKSEKANGKLATIGVAALKQYLVDQHIPCRPPLVGPVST